LNRSNLKDLSVIKQFFDVMKLTQLYWHRYTHSSRLFVACILLVVLVIVRSSYYNICMEVYKVIVFVTTIRVTNNKKLYSGDEYLPQVNNMNSDARGRIKWK